MPADAPAPDPSSPLPDEWHRRAELRDGTQVLLRPIRAQDRQRLAEGMARLSPRSRYLRFHTEVEELSEEQLDYLSQVDHVDHEAIIAIDLDHPEIPGVGIARYVRERSDPTIAEAAVTVADEYQGKGAGTLLLGALAARARENGISGFRSFVLVVNRAMLELFDDLGADRQIEPGGVWRVDLPVPHGDEPLPDSPAGRAFLEIARDEQRSARVLPRFGHRPQRHHRTRDRR